MIDVYRANQPGSTMANKDDEAGLDIARKLRQDIARHFPGAAGSPIQAVMAHLNGRHAEAARGYADHPSQPLALFGAALLAFQQGQLPQAFRLLCVVTDKAPAFAPGWYNLGLVLQLLGNAGEALECQDKALALDPKLVEAHNQRGVALLDLGRHPEAVAAFGDAIRYAGTGHEARFNRAIALLLTGDWERGWPEYESRHEVMWLPKPIIPPHVPAWDGSPLEGRHLLVWCEQGYGDTLQMCRFLPALARMGTVTAVVPQRLQRLLAAAFPDVGIITTGDDYPERMDVQCGFMSLPALLKVTPDTAWEGPYLATEAAA